MGSYVSSLAASLLALSLTTTAAAQTAGRAPAPAQPSKAPAAEAAAPAPAREALAADQVERIEPAARMEPPTGHITSTTGTVTLERANQIEDAAPGLPLMAGDRLRTDNASADITWADNSTLRLARFTELDILSRHMVRVPRGTLNIALALAPGQAASEQLAIDAPAASIRFFAAGRYRISVTGNDEVEVELAVIEGNAQLVSDQGQVALAAGEKALIRGGGAPTAPAGLTAQANDASQYDYSADVAAFQSSGQGYASTQYLPSELYGYASVLDANGSWDSDPSYGYVWYPRVGADWRPYSYGQWRYYKPWGWTWMGRDRWAYPTHHYGRWGVGNRGWYWIPANQWGPAWVSWGFSSNYVSWSPLGWNGRPVVNIYNYNVYNGPAYRRPGRSWTVVPSNRFGYHDVTRYRLNDDYLYRERPSFITQRVGPPIPRSGPTAIPRGNVIVPRSNVAVPRTGGNIGNARGGSTLGRIEPLDEPTNANVPPGVYYRRVPGDADEGYRSESPYDRARRVMERRGDAQGRDENGAGRSPNGSIDVNGAGANTPTAVPRGMIGPGDPNAPQYIYPRGRAPYGVTPRNDNPSSTDIDNAPRRGPGRSGGSLDDDAPRRAPGAMYRGRSQGSTPPPPPPAGATPPPSSDNTAAPRATQRPPENNDGGGSRAGRSSGRSSEGRSGSGEGARRRQP